MELNNLLEQINRRTSERFERKPKVEFKTDLDLSKLPVDAKTWHRLKDVVAVFFDLKSSTNLEKGRQPASTASIYDAGVGGVVKVLDAFDANFIDIQGDGGFALFWNNDRYRRALCAAISIKTFSTDFTNKLEKKWPEAPATGFKIGVASGPVLVKKVGIPRQPDVQEPVWAGRPVNYAAKAAQQTEPKSILITGSVWDEIMDNDYFAFSCGCVEGKPESVTPTLLWEQHKIEKIPDDEKFGQALTSGWCGNHGEEFCNAILAGETRRTDITKEAQSSRNLLASGSVETNEASRHRRQQKQAQEQAFATARSAQLSYWGREEKHLSSDE